MANEDNQQPAPSVPPKLTFSEAEVIGVALHDHLEKQLGTAPMARDDMGWGDVVQFVLRRASETVIEREDNTDD
jgi:hypothetical protein